MAIYDGWRDSALPAASRCCYRCRCCCYCCFTVAPLPAGRLQCLLFNFFTRVREHL
jgi:hypothetical protein